MNRPNWGVDAELDLVRAEGLAMIEQTPNASLHTGMFRGSGKLLRPRLLLLCAAHGAETGAKPDWQRARAAVLAVGTIGRATGTSDAVLGIVTLAGIQRTVGDFMRPQAT